MASSLSELLAQEGFQRRQKSTREQCVSIPVFICQKERPSSRNERSNSKKSYVLIDDVVSVLSGYVGRYLKDHIFREKLRELCVPCLESTLRSDLVEKLEMGMESVDRLVEHSVVNGDDKRSAVDSLSTVVSNSHSNSTIKSCAHLYLAILHKHYRNDTKSASHLLRLFCESPFLARTHLLVDLWEHLFLPHLLHLKVWLANEIDCLSHSDSDRDAKLKALTNLYNRHVDNGTMHFASYYKKRLKLGAVAGSPAVPVVPLPARPYPRSSMDTCSTTSSLNNNLYDAVFGPTSRRPSASSISRIGTLKDLWDLSEEEDNLTSEDTTSSFNSRSFSRAASTQRSRRRSSSQHERSRKVEHFRFFACQQRVPLECSTVTRNKKEERLSVSPRLMGAINALSCSDSLEECEEAVRMIALSRRRTSMCQTPVVVEGILEVLWASEDDEVCELGLSVLGELGGKSELNRVVILNADPQLDVFRRHLRSSGRLFLRAAAALHQLRPTTAHMAAAEWVPLVLRVLEFSGRDHSAALYLLRQLLLGFEDDDRNEENARQVVCLGGLCVLAAKISAASGEVADRFYAVEFLSCCVSADGSCRNYLADVLTVEPLVELILLECRRTAPSGPALSLLLHLLCLQRRTQTNIILERVKQGWGGFNGMHILCAYLHKAKPEDRPLIAAILLQLDLLEDPSEVSVYREEAVEAIIGGLQDETVQHKSARALLMLGGRFSSTGEAMTENWILKGAGFDQRVYDDDTQAPTEQWQRRAAAVLLASKRFLIALSDSITNAIPSLSRASLVTLSWMLIYLCDIGNENLQTMACSILVPCLLDSLDHRVDVEARVIASYSLLNLSTNSADCVSNILSLGKDELLNNLRHLRLVTWTANQLLSIITS